MSNEGKHPADEWDVLIHRYDTTKKDRLELELLVEILREMRKLNEQLQVLRWRVT